MSPRFVFRSATKHQPQGATDESGFSVFSWERIHTIAIDTETTGLDPWGTLGVDRKFAPCRPFFIAICDTEGNTASFRFPVNKKTREVIFPARPSGNLRALLDCIESPNITKVLANFKFDACMLKKAFGVTFRGRIVDVLLTQYLTDPTAYNIDLKSLCAKFLKISTEDEDALHAATLEGRREAKAKGWAFAEEVKADYHLAAPAILEKYGRLDAFRTMALHQAQQEALNNKENADTLFAPGIGELIEREHAVMMELMRMEETGVRIDTGTLADLSDLYRGIVEENAKTIAKEAKTKDFNVNSAPQKQVEFFGNRKLTPLAYSSKGRGRSLVYSQCRWCKGRGCRICQETGRSPKCDADFLDHVGVDRTGGGFKPKDRLAFAMLHHSAADTMLGFCEQYGEKACEEKASGIPYPVKILHPNYNQTTVKTTRLSSSNPNLQNVASDDSGKKKTAIPYRVRELFTPRPGKAFLAPDYSQIEVWVLALLAGDKAFLNQLAKGGDAHQIVADMIWPGAYNRATVKKAKAKEKAGKPLTEEEKAEKKKAARVRKIVKTINFGIMYGSGDDKTGEAIGVSTEEARKMKAEYFATFPAVQAFMERIQKEAKRLGYVDSPYGVRYRAERGAEYRLTNYIIQGTAAQILKSGMVKLGELFRKKYQGRSEMLLQIHDELLIECDKALAESLEFRKEVEGCLATDWKRLGCPIPFPIGMKFTESAWGFAKDVA
jgi:DNA polymerase I-like protein with 3'-5' exonuclease and polymerase domains